MYNKKINNINNLKLKNMKKMNFDDAINEIKKLIENTDFEIDYSECDEKDEFVYITIKIASAND